MKESLINKISKTEQIGTALSFLLFPVLFVSAQLLHPNMFHVGIVTNGRQWIEHFRGQNLLHVGHLLEFICAPLLIIMAMHYKKVLRNGSPLLSFAGVCMVFIGSLMLLGSKSAFCFTISGFDTLSDQQLLQLVPGLDVLLQKKGLLAVLWLLPMLPVGYVLVGISIFKTKLVPGWQGILIITGSLMLANPEIEAVNFFASLFLFAGLVPYSVRLFKNIKDKRRM